MKCNIKRHTNILYIFLSLLFVYPLSTYSFEHDIETAWDDDIPLDPLDEFELNNDLHFNEITKGNAPLDPFQVVTILTSDSVEAQKVLLEDLYNRTNPLNTRSLLDLPSFYYPYCCPTFDECGKSTRLLIQPFFNNTDRAYFTKDSIRISSYLDINNQNILQKVDENFLNNQIPDVLDVVDKVRIQERKLGVMFGSYYDKGPWHIEWRTPLYELERNFYLTEEEQEMLQILSPSGGIQGIDFDTFKYDHLVSDRFGLGDTRFIIGHDLYEKECFNLYGGLFSTIPTAFAFKKGLIGTHFTGKIVPISLLEVVNLLFPGPNQNIPLGIEKTTDFLLGALDNLSAMLVESKLGNGGHLGLGGFLEHDLCLNSCLSWHTRGALEYLFPAYERRFYIQEKNASEFLNRDYDNQAQADENLAFLNEQLIATLYPRPYQTLVRPGFIFRLTSDLAYYLRQWNFRLGYDLWWQDKETLGHARTPDLTILESTKLRKNIAGKSSAMQQKIWGAISYQKKGKKRDWCISLLADSTFFSYGIGEDVTLSLRFGINI